MNTQTPASTASAITDALDAVHFYIDACDEELREAGMTRDDALRRARELRDALSAPTAQPVGQAEGEQDPCDALRDKLESVINYATGGKLSQSGWALSTIKSAIDEHVNAAVEPSQPAYDHTSCSDFLRSFFNANGRTPTTREAYRAAFEAGASTSPAPAAPSGIAKAAQAAWDAYSAHTARLCAAKPGAAITGPIDEEMLALRMALKAAALAASTKGDA